MNIDLSVIKRRSEPTEVVVNRLKTQGFSETGTVLSGKFTYMENSEGIGLTVVDGPSGTVIMPSGPVRGMVFGENSVGFGIMRSSSSGNGSSTSTSNSRGAAGDNTFNV